LGVTYPIIPGHEPLGIIDEIGEKAARRWGVAPGDRVAVEPLMPCGTCAMCLGGYYTSCTARRLTERLYSCIRTMSLRRSGEATHNTCTVTQTRSFTGSQKKSQRRSV
jgi:threonine dehydrogenase-like Zn-dependent dehydrogenase